MESPIRLEELGGGAGREGLRRVEVGPEDLLCDPENPFDRKDLFGLSRFAGLESFGNSWLPLPDEFGQRRLRSSAACGFSEGVSWRCERVHRLRIFRTELQSQYQSALGLNSCGYTVYA